MAKKEMKEEKTWMPSLKWLCEVFLIIVFFVVMFFFILNFLLQPYMRDIPMEVTPWLDNSSQQTDSVKNQEVNEIQK